MDRVLTPQEWACKGEKPQTDVLLNSESVLEYAKYYHSKQPKKDIILPKRPQGYVSYDNIYFREGIKCGKTQTIDEVKRLNSIQ